MASLRITQTSLLQFPTRSQESQINVIQFLCLEMGFFHLQESAEKSEDGAQENRVRAEVEFFAETKQNLEEVENHRGRRQQRSCRGRTLMGKRRLEMREYVLMHKTLE